MGLIHTYLYSFRTAGWLRLIVALALLCTTWTYWSAASQSSRDGDRTEAITSPQNTGATPGVDLRKHGDAKFRFAPVPQGAVAGCAPVSENILPPAADGGWTLQLLHHTMLYVQVVTAEL